MKKKLALVAMISCLALSVVGCKGANNSKGEDSVTSTTPKTVTDYSSFVTLGEYKGIEVVAVEVAEVTEEDLATEIQNVLDNNVKTEEITDRAVKDGDTVNIDYEGLLDGVAFEGGTDTGYDLTIGSNSFIDGFEEQLIGAKIGDKKSLNVTFPEDYGTATLAGKAVVFNVTVNSISVKTTPELTDEFVKTNFKFDTVEKYKENLTTTLNEKNEATALATKKDNIMQAIVANATISEYPQDEIDAYMASATEYYTELATSNGTDFATFISSMGMTEDTFNSQFSEYAKQAVATQMVVQAIAKKEKIKISDKEYKEALTKYSADYGVTEDKLLEVNGEAKIKEQALFDKVVEFVTEQSVEVEATPAPAATTAPETKATTAPEKTE